MKKFFALLSILIFVFALSSCIGNDAEQPSEKNESQQSPEGNESQRSSEGLE